MSERITLTSDSPPGPAPFRTLPPMGVILAPLFLLLGAVAGWVAHQLVEQTHETALHAQRLQPLLAYDPKFYEQAASSKNDDHRRLQFLLHATVSDGCDLRAVLDAAMPTTQVPPALKKLTMDRLLENFQQGEAFGLHTPENLALLFEGRSPTITKGEYSGMRADSEHIVPKSVVPRLDNLLMNLEWLPSSLNQSKGNQITDRAYQYATRYHEAGIMRSDDFAKVEKLFQDDR